MWWASLAIAVVVPSVLVTGCGRGPGPDSGQIERGRALYEANCRVCHGDATTGAGAIPQAPSHGPDGHTWHHPDGQLLDIVLGRLQYPGRAMPSFAGVLSEEEVWTILAYLKTNWASEQRSFQEEASRHWEVLERRGR